MPVTNEKRTERKNSTVTGCQEISKLLQLKTDETVQSKLTLQIIM